jgi:hypothetical protein
MRSLVIRIIFSLALVALLALPAATASAQAQAQAGPTLVVENPSPGAMLALGKLEMQGMAFDPVATMGSGVDRVSVFLDNRDEGGMFLGDATLAAPATVDWTLLTPVLKGTGDGHSLFVYARSAVTGDETVVKIPVTIGDAVHPTGGASEGVSIPGEIPSPPSGIDSPADTSGM